MQVRERVNHQLEDIVVVGPSVGVGGGIRDAPIGSVLLHVRAYDGEGGGNMFLCRE